MRKADYSKIAEVYDKGRSLSEQNIDLWLGIISKYYRASEGARLLDLGCGTGRFAIPIATRLHYKVTGADSSEEMLVKARQKDTSRLVKWDMEDVQDLTYPDKSFDIVFMSFLLHHCDNQDKAIRECQRVLDDTGVILIRHAGIEQIRDDVVHTFFPEVVAIDESRIFSVRKMEQHLKEAGFSGIVSEEIIQQTYTVGAEHLKAVLLKNTSGLTMIPQEAFEKGVRLLRQYVDKNPIAPWLLYDRMTITAGYKGKMI